MRCPRPTVLVALAPRLESGDRGGVNTEGRTVNTDETHNQASNLVTPPHELMG